MPRDIASAHVKKPPADVLECELFHDSRKDHTLNPVRGRVCRVILPVSSFNPMVRSVLRPELDVNLRRESGGAWGS